MLDTVDFNHVQHISFAQSRLTDAVSVILSESLSYEHPPKVRGLLFLAFLVKGKPPIGNVLFIQLIIGFRAGIPELIALPADRHLTYVGIVA